MGKVAALDPGARIVEAIAVAGGRILALGSNEAITAYAEPDTRRIDAAGRLVVTGLLDGHAHMVREGLEAILPSLAGCTCLDDVLDRVPALVAETPKGDWIVTMPIGEPPFYKDVPSNLADSPPVTTSCRAIARSQFKATSRSSRKTAATCVATMAHRYSRPCSSRHRSRPRRSPAREPENTRCVLARKSQCSGWC